MKNQVTTGLTALDSPKIGKKRQICDKYFRPRYLFLFIKNREYVQCL